MSSDPRVKGYAALAAAFVLGVAAGGGAAYGFAQQRYARFLGERPAFWESRRIGALSRRLDLDSAQRDRVRVVMEKHAGERRRIEREMLERCGEPLRAEQVEIDAEVRAVLRPEQAARFDEMAKRRERFLRQP